jgi:hypothetical protein
MSLVSKSIQRCSYYTDAYKAPSLTLRSLIQKTSTNAYVFLQNPNRVYSDTPYIPHPNHYFIPYLMSHHHRDTYHPQHPLPPPLPKPTKDKPPQRPMPYPHPQPDPMPHPKPSPIPYPSPKDDPHPIPYPYPYPYPMPYPLYPL